MWPDFHRYLEQEWPEIRAAGRDNFVWKHRVLPFGIPIACFGVIWFYYLSGFGPSAIITRQGASLAYYTVGVTVIVVYVYARVECADRERRYLESQGK